MSAVVLLQRFTTACKGYCDVKERLINRYNMISLDNKKRMSLWWHCAAPSGHPQYQNQEQDILETPQKRNQDLSQLLPRTLSWTANAAATTDSFHKRHIKGMGKGYRVLSDDRIKR